MKWPLALVLCVAGLTSPGQSDLAAQRNPPSLSADLIQLEKLTRWSKSNPGADRDPATTCGIGASSRYGRVRLDHEVLPNTDDVTANREISELDRRVVRYLVKQGWSAMRLGKHEGIPDMKRCFQKDVSFVQVFKTTGRCTMNSRCTAYDGFAVIMYLASDRQGKPAL